MTAVTGPRFDRYFSEGASTRAPDRGLLVGAIGARIWGAVWSGSQRRPIGDPEREVRDGFEALARAPYESGAHSHSYEARR